MMINNNNNVFQRLLKNIIKQSALCRVNVYEISSNSLFLFAIKKIKNSRPPPC